MNSDAINLQLIELKDMIIQLNQTITNQNTLIQKYLAKLVTFDADQLLLADANADNKVNIKDATYIQKKIAYLI